MPKTFNPDRPISSLVPEGETCQLTEEWQPITLESKEQISPDTYVFTFTCPDKSKPLYLSTCSCIIATMDPSPESGEKPIIKPYTPISTNARVGSFQLMIKIYPDGRFTPLLEKLNNGDSVHFKQVPFNIKIQYKPKSLELEKAKGSFGSIKNLAMVVGGTGITPMIQILNAVLGDNGREDKEDVKITMLVGNKTADDILAKEILDKWLEIKDVKERLTVVHVLSREAGRQGSTWTGETGRIGKELIERHFPGPETECLIFVCGPPPMYKSLCGPRDDPELTGVLKELEYNKNQVYKF